MRIRITEAGRGVNIQGDGREPGTVLDVNKHDADYFLVRGFAELVEEPAAAEEPESDTAEMETATAEPQAETEMRPAARRRRGGST